MSPVLRMQHVSSTYYFHNLGLEGTDSRANSSKISMHRFATTAETGEPMVAPSLCSQFTTIAEVGRSQVHMQ